MSTILLISLGLALGFFATVVAEYPIHRFVMHSRIWPFERIWQAHAGWHHCKWYKIFDYEPDPVGRVVNLRLDYATTLLLGSPVWGLLCYFWGWPLGVGFAAGSVAHNAVWNTLHEEMHNPRGRWFRKTWFFQYCHNHHRLHHLHRHKNMGLLTGLFDSLFGTRVR